MALVDSAIYEPMLDHNPLEKWMSDSGRVAVLGDAAHSLLVGHLVFVLIVVFRCSD